MSKQHNSMFRPGLEAWGGVECTVNRVGDRYLDQLERNGHAWRASDLELFARLGIRALRYPILWERTAPQEGAEPDWTWADERLQTLRQLNIAPIVGLVHHGSGPRHTSLLDPEFPNKLAAYALAVAKRYPWLERYTPINEPLTTARFSGLYGHWYPHGTDGQTFVRALLTQCRATQLAMRAIRSVNSSARLVQTEDMGKVFSSRRLAYQANFENERRWLSFDLLCGRVDSHHPLWNYLRWLGIEEAELKPFLEAPCPPDIFGINYYVTSERFLDERLHLYPAELHGGNHRHKYADVAAVRVCAEGMAGPRKIIEEVWERYHAPVAVTEAHLGCTREEQLRWLAEVWEAACDAHDNGVDIRAVTAWSLLGAYDWDSLLTRADGRYESGVFDVVGGSPRPTALAKLLENLANGDDSRHPVLAVPGWWRREERLLYPPMRRSSGRGDCPVRQGELSDYSQSLAKNSRTSTIVYTEDVAREVQPLLITGGTGTLGRAFARLCQLRAIPHRLLTRADLDIANPEMVDRALQTYMPWAIVNTAGYVRVDEAEANAEICFRENTIGPSVLATACDRHKVGLLTFSSDLVFDGGRANPYVESDRALPLNVYGRSKAEAEARVLDSCPGALVVRTSAFFGPWDHHNFVTIALRTLLLGESFIAADDAVISPTYVPDLVNACLDLLIDGEAGLWHLVNHGSVTWAELARVAASHASLRKSRIHAQPARMLGWTAPRPPYSVLGSERSQLLPTLDDALRRYTESMYHDHEHPLHHALHAEHASRVA